MVKLNNMAFQPPSARQELANRKILEELQLKKQLLLKQGVAPTLNSAMSPGISSTGANASAIAPDTHVMSSSQKALQHAHSQSFGSFVAQDSLFGNLILPVLPRFDNKPHIINNLFHYKKSFMKLRLTPQIMAHLLFMAQKIASSHIQPTVAREWWGGISKPNSRPPLFTLMLNTCDVNKDVSKN